MEIETKFHIVFVDLPGEVVQELVIAVDAVPRIAGAGAQLGNATHQNDRKARVGNAGSGAACERTGRTKTDRTRIKASVTGKETFRETIPAVADFVHLVRAKSVDIRQGDQLDSRWGVGVKSGELTAP